MKKIVFILIIVIAVSKVYGQVDSMRILRDSIYANKANYIGQPLSKLFNDIKALDISFSSPDNIGSLRKGTAYYKNFMLFFPWVEGKGFEILNIIIDNKVYVNIEEWIECERNGTAGRKLRLLLKNEIVTNIVVY